MSMTQKQRTAAIALTRREITRALDRLRQAEMSSAKATEADKKVELAQDHLRAAIRHLDPPKPKPPVPGTLR